MPGTVTVAVTDRSALMSTGALPVADVVTGGTSAAPLKSIFWPPIIGAIVAQLPNNPTAPANNSVENATGLLAILIIFFSFEGPFFGCRDIGTRHASYDNTDHLRRTEIERPL